MVARRQVKTTLLAMLCMMASGAQSQQAGVAPRATEEGQTAAANSAGAQGLRIHGHWVLQVKNPDGSLGERREFDNALTKVGGSEISGDQIIGAMLAGNLVPGDPGIALSSNVAAIADPGTICLNTDGKLASGGAGCGVLTTATSFLYSGSPLVAAGSTQQSGLTKLVTLSPAVTWVLSGNYTVVPNQTTIGTVQTLIGVCIAPSSVPGSINTSGAANQNQFLGSSSVRTVPAGPASCDLTNYVAAQVGPRVGTLTSTLVTPNALTVTPGQIVQVTVTISFS